MSEKKLQLSIGIHSHQPFGNFDNVIEAALTRCYLPFIEAIKSHPSIKWTVHYSGPLLLWAEKHSRRLIDALAELLSRGQIEILGSGIGEPILCSIPPRDVEMQLEEMNTLLSRLFGVRPRGIWLTERIWEPILPALLAPLGVEYVLVDDHHFFYAGFQKGALDGFYSAEKHGHSIKVFPISQALRYRIPFKPVPDLIAEFKTWRDNIPSTADSIALTYLDDGEKFGIWPGTYEWVYEKRWLDLFLEALEQNSDWLETKFLSEISDERTPTARASLPTASYYELMEWALPPKAAKEREELSRKLGEENYSKLGGGFWDQFLVKYEESNRLHKRMMGLSERLYELEGKYSEKGEKGKKLKTLRSMLHLTQCNDVYWHGLFGGLYLPFLRSSIYRTLIELEQGLNEVEPSFGVLESDFDRDGTKEVIVRTPNQTLVLSGRHNGNVYLWDDSYLRLSLSDLLTRREEAYHGKVKTAGKNGEGDAPKSIHHITASKEQDLERYLTYDKRLRLTGAFYIIRGALSATTVRNGTFEELGNLGSVEYSPPEINRVSGAYKVAFRAKGAKIEGKPLSVTKNYSISENGAGFSITVSIHGESIAVADFTACLELNFTFDALDDGRYISAAETERTPLNAEKDWRNIEAARIVDEVRKGEILISLSHKSSAALFPVETVSISESGFERNYQGSCLVFGVPLSDIYNAGLFTLKVERKVL